MQHTALTGPVWIFLYISDKEACGDRQGCGQNKEAISLGSQNRCLKKIIVTESL